MRRSLAPLVLLGSLGAACVDLAPPDRLKVRPDLDGGATVDLPAEAAGDLPEELAMDLPADRAADLPAPDLPREAAPDLVADLPMDLPADLPVDAPSDLPPDRSSDLPPDLAADRPPDAASLPLGLVAYWKLDETSGTVAADSSPLRIDGAHVGSPSISTQVAPVGFPNARSLVFNGSTSYVRIPYSPRHAFKKTDSYTLSLWVRTPATLPAGWRAFLSKTNLDAYYGIWLSDLRSFTCAGAIGPGTTGRQNIGGTTLAVPSTWYHVACVQDGAAGTRKLYVNGVQEADGVALPGDKVADLWIGAVDGISEYWNGQIDDVRIYDRALPLAEIAALPGGP